MAVEPLFVESMDILRSRLRLTGASSSDASAMIEEAVERARFGLFDRLGDSRVTELVGYANSDNPSSTEGLLRKKANRAETLWVRITLLREMPVLFMDASNDTEQIWNEEGLTRTSGGNDLKRRIEEAQIELDALLGELDTSGNGSGKVQAFLGGQETPVEPGYSIDPSRSST